MRIAVLLTGLSVSLLGAASLLGAGTASAADCGGVGFNRVACDCADSVTRSTVLQRSDPAVSRICPNDGLRIGADGILLDCAGLTLTGEDSNNGIELIGRSRVIVTRCQVTGFNDGIDVKDSSNNQFIRNVLFQNDDDGVELTGDSDSNLVGFNQIEENQEDGIDLDSENDGADSPDRNTIQANFIAGNNLDERGEGIEDCATCTGNRYLFNVVQDTVLDDDDAGNGIKIEGLENVILGNQGSQNGGTGLLVTGESNILRSNRFDNNGQNGICAVAGNRNSFGNRGSNNVGANVAFDAPSCPIGIAPSGAIASAAPPLTPTMSGATLRQRLSGN